MPPRTASNEGVVDQRYYHFLVLRTKTKAREKYWGALAAVGRSGDALDAASGSLGPFEHRRLVSSRVYARGAIAERISASGNGQPPYAYDLVAAQLAASTGQSYLVIGFPFSSLAMELSQTLLGTSGRAALGQFACIDIPKLIRLMEREGPAHTDTLKAGVVGVEASVRGDKSLTAVRLGGDDPLNAELYQSYLHTRIIDGSIVPDHCVLACEDMPSESTRGVLRPLRSRVHIDRYGNFKFYAHIALANIALMTETVALLDRLECVQDAERNPAVRLRVEEEVV